MYLHKYYGTKTENVNIIQGNKKCGIRFSGKEKVWHTHVHMSKHIFIKHNRSEYTTKYKQLFEFTGKTGFTSSSSS